MTVYDLLPSNVIRKYIWDSIVEQDILDINNYYADGFYESLIPIIPTQEVPEFNNLLPGRTYMLYDYETKNIPSQWWMSEDSMTISIISQNYEKIGEIQNLIIDLFRRYDESATDINKYNGEPGPFMFHYTAIDSVMSPEPFNTEGDYQIGSIVFSYHYSRKTDRSGRFSSTETN
jgi:hypothetical protein